MAMVLSCTPSPEATCDRIVRLAPDNKRDVAEKCLSTMRQMQATDPAAYKCTAKCVATVESFDSAIGCMAHCTFGPHETSEKRVSARN